jgi:hypothetical protein
MWSLIAVCHVHHHGHAGLRSALANQPVKRMQGLAPRQRAKKPRQQRINIEKATNAHLPFLFAATQPKSLDA